MEHLDYLKWQLFFAWLPIAVVWLLYWKILLKHLKTILFCIIGGTAIAFPWDYWATHSWLWGFSKVHTTGIVFLGLPIEEWSLFISEIVLYSSLSLVLYTFLKKEGKKIG